MVNVTNSPKEFFEVHINVSMSFTSFVLIVAFLFFSTSLAASFLSMYPVQLMLKRVKNRSVIAINELLFDFLTF